MATRLSLVAIAAALAIALSACGGAGAASTAGTTAATSSATTGGSNGGRQLTGAQQQALQAYRDCMKQNGVDLPAGGGLGRGQGGGGPSSSGSTPSNTGGTPAASARPPQSLPPGVDQATFDKAQAACSSKLPTGGLGQGQARGGAAFQAYLSCLRDNGVPVPTTQAGVSGPPPSIDRTAPAFAAADAKCRVLLPTPSSTSTTQG